MGVAVGHLRTEDALQHPQTDAESEAGLPDVVHVFVTDAADAMQTRVGQPAVGPAVCERSPKRPVQGQLRSMDASSCADRGSVHPQAIYPSGFLAESIEGASRGPAPSASRVKMGRQIYLYNCWPGGI